jgi:hypothetical protein
LNTDKSTRFLLLAAFFCAIEELRAGSEQVGDAKDYSKDTASHSFPADLNFNQASDMISKACSRWQVGLFGIATVFSLPRPSIAQDKKR